MARSPQAITGVSFIMLFIVYVWLASRRRQRRQQGFMDLSALIGAASGMVAPQAGVTTPAELLQPAINGNVANESFRKVLIYAENNPNDLSKFLNFLKANFFAPDAQFADPTPTSGLVSRYRNVFREDIIEASATEASASSNI